MQIVGLEEADGYEHISPENFEGVTLKENSVDITISTRPIMGFVEFNVIISQLEYIDHLADKVQLITQYLLNDYMNGRCDSYNLFSTKCRTASVIFVRLYHGLSLLLTTSAIKYLRSTKTIA